jgi:enamine deaminase RidA (YjgF/YER057c/UK114 family)
VTIIFHFFYMPRAAFISRAKVERARREFFTGAFPASTLVEVRSLAKPEVLVEIETVAWLGRS